MKIFYVLIYILFTTMGLVFMKLGGGNFQLKLTSGIDFKIGYLTLLGFIFYVVSFLLWQKLLVEFEIIHIYAIVTGILQILIFVLGILIFKEKFNIYNVIGVVIIIIGIILVSYKSKVI